MSSLTQTLLAHSPTAFRHATQAPFLTLAGHGTLPKVILEEWLGQDRLYAQAYIRFASLLLANIPMPMTVDASHVNEKIVDLLIEAITNVRTELKFFEDVARRYGLQLEVKEIGLGVNMYRDLFGEIGEGVEQGERSVLEGLVLLWGTEKVYLEAWRHAGSFLPPADEGREDLDGGALRREFIPNWSSDEFAAFVERIAGLVDEIWDGGAVLERGIGWQMRATKYETERQLRELWGEVLEVEKAFWPDDD